MKDRTSNFFPLLETKRVILRELNSTYVDVIFDFNSCNKSLEYIIREPFKTKQEAIQKLKMFISGMKEKSAYWWVFTLKETGENIGYGGLFDISKEHNRAEIGYGLIKKYWGKGYMSEILTEIVRFGISTAGFHKISGIVIQGNSTSVKLLENNNFQKEAHLKEHSFLRGTYYDEMIYSLLK